jgi:hypothetical protein
MTIPAMSWENPDVIVEATRLTVDSWVDTKVWVKVDRPIGAVVRPIRRTIETTLLQTVLTTMEGK